MPDLLNLLKFCEHSDVILKRIHEHPDEVNSFDEDGLSPLWIAAERGDLKIVQSLLSAGAKNDKACKDGYTPLMVAAINGHKKVTQILLDAGADLDKTNNKGSFPLFLAAEYGHTEVVKALLDAGAEKDKLLFVFTPIAMAAIEGHLETVKILFEAGADINKTHRHYWLTPLKRAAFFDRIEVLKLFAQHYQSTPLILHSIITGFYVCNGTYDTKQILAESLVERINLVNKPELSDDWPVCPITQQPIVDALTSPEGHHFESYAILKWLDESKTNPLTRAQLTCDKLKKDESIRSFIEEKIKHLDKLYEGHILKAQISELTDSILKKYLGPAFSGTSNVHHLGLFSSSRSSISKYNVSEFNFGSSLGGGGGGSL